MTAYLTRRLGTSIVILIGISIFIFILLLFLSALENEDYPVLLAYTLVGAVLTVLGNLLADIALTIADPRIRLS